MVHELCEVARQPSGHTAVVVDHIVHEGLAVDEDAIVLNGVEVVCVEDWQEDVGKDDEC